MPYATVDVEKIVNEKCETSPEFKKAWDDSREEYRLIGEMIALRKAEALTQTDIAERSGSCQQTISRIEKKETNPSLKSFCNILNAMGYELQIVKRTSA